MSELRIEEGSVLKEFGPGPGPMKARVIVSKGDPHLEVSLDGAPGKGMNGTSWSPWIRVASGFKQGDTSIWPKLEVLFGKENFSRRSYEGWRARLGIIAAYGQEVANHRVSGVCPTCGGGVVGDGTQECATCEGDGVVKHMRFTLYEELKAIAETAKRMREKACQKQA